MRYTIDNAWRASDEFLTNAAIPKWKATSCRSIIANLVVGKEVLENQSAQQSDDHTRPCCLSFSGETWVNSQLSQARCVFIDAGVVGGHRLSTSILAQLRDYITSGIISLFGPITYAMGRRKVITTGTISTIIKGKLVSSSGRWMLINQIRSCVSIYRI